MDYDLDTDDEAWLDSFNSSSTAESHIVDKDRFEQLMDRLERATPDEVSWGFSLLNTYLYFCDLSGLAWVACSFVTLCRAFLERSHGFLFDDLQNLISYDEARNLLEVDDHIVKAVYGFWKGV